MKNGHTSDTLTAQGRKVMIAVEALKSKPYVDVGILSKDFEKPKKVPEGEKPGDRTLGQIATDNEFGAPKAGVPARSFIRSTVDKHQKEWESYIEDLHDQVLEGRITTDVALGRLGERIKRDIQATIRSNVGPPNKPETIARKLGQSGLTGRKLRKAEIAAAFGQGTLRNTGQLLNAMAWEIGRGMVGDGGGAIAQ